MMIRLSYQIWSPDLEPEQETTNVAIVGCGFYAQNHLNAWKYLQSQGVELVSVCDLDPKKAKTAGEKFGAAWYTDADEMLGTENIDILDIATQMGSHRALAAKAAKRRIASVIQKPLAPNLEESIAIVDCAEENDAWIAVHENFRFSTVMRRIQAEIDSNAIGTPNWARLTFRTGYDVYAEQPYLMREERLAILDSGIHLLDLARFFLGEVERISCETQRRNPRVRGDDTATMMLRHTSGAVSVVETTYEAHRIPDAFPSTLLEIEGPDGSIILSHQDTMTVTSRGEARTEHIGSPLLPWTSQPWHGSQEAVLNANTHFLESFRANKPAETSGADNLKTFALVEAAYLAAQLQIAVKPQSF
jgi:predicted dehydrogenase